MMGCGFFALSNPLPVSNGQEGHLAHPDSTKSATVVSHLLHQGGGKPDSAFKKEEVSNHSHHEMIVPKDSLTISDYTLSIERVNDNIISIGDSAKLGFEVVLMGRRIGEMTNDVQLIRQNIRGRNSAFNIKNQFLYQRYTDKLESETDQIQAKLNDWYRRVFQAKTDLRGALTDSVFQKMFANKVLRVEFNEKLTRLERKWHRTDSLTKANVDTLNSLKVRLSDNSYNLSNMLSVLDKRMDRAIPSLFGSEVNNLWEKEHIDPAVRPTTTKAVTILQGEQNAIVYYINQTSGERKFIFIFGVFLFVWLYLRRKLLKKIGKHKELYSYLHLNYMNKRPVVSMVVLLLCLMPFFDAYAPTSYISVIYLFLLISISLIFIREEKPAFLLNWLVLVFLFVADVLAYLVLEPTLKDRLLMLAIHSGILWFAIRFYRSLHRQKPYYHFLRWATILGVLLSGLGILLNFFGRFSLSGIAGIAAIIAVTQAVVLTVFIEIVIEVVLLQLQSSRLKKSNDKSFDTDIVVTKIKLPLIVLAVFIWMITLASNLNIYHIIRKGVVEALTSTRTIGSINFQLISVILFFLIIWLAHVLQRLLSFYFGETGLETDDLTAVTKGQHSRLLVTRLLVLIGGYLLAIAASGLPIDKLTFLLGALGVGIGMGLQGIVNNFVSGIILIFDGSLQIGDEIEIGGQAGKVKEIGLRSSMLSTADGAEVIIPNGTILSQNIVNWTYSNNEKRLMIHFSLTGKELDANVVNEVINGTLKNMANVIAKRNPVILYTKVSTEACSLTVRFWTSIGKADQVKSEAMLRLSAAFSAKSIGFE